MNVIAKRSLRAFWERHAQAQTLLTEWYKTMTKGRFEHFNALRDAFPSADLLEDGLIVFNISGNKYRLVVDIDFGRRVAFIKRVMTHAEYDRWNQRGRKL